MLSISSRNKWREGEVLILEVFLFGSFNLLNLIFKLLLLICWADITFVEL